MPSPPTVAVVGGGCSGTLTAAQLLRRSDGPLRVVLVERRPEVGGGVAYSTDDPRHLLNVPAGKMSGLPDAPEHFLRWLQAGPMPEAEAGTFVPRRLFGAYLAALLDAAEADAAPGGRLDRLHAEVADMRVTEDGVTLVLAEPAPAKAGGGTLRADRAVLAVGHGAPTDPVDGALDASTRYVSDPWAPGAMDGIAPDETVLFAGTSLTMVDWAVSLGARGHTGPMLAVSRRGLVPHAHAPSPPAPAVDDVSLLRRLKGAGEAWRAAVDGLRPQTQALWHGLPDVERHRFLRHLRPFWDVHRHRIAPESAAALRVMQEAGRLAVRAGRILHVLPEPDGLRVTVRYRGATEPEAVRVDQLVNCTGTSLRCAEADHPLLDGLLARGHARLHPLGLGLDVDADGALVSVEGQASDRLFTLGPPRVGRLWETTAVPEIRAQAEALARLLLRAGAPSSSLAEAA